MPTIPAVSRELLYIRNVQAFDADSPDSATDPTTLPVQVAFMLTGEPTTADWHDAEWEDATTARILLGPGGGVVLTAGRYGIWLRVTGAVEEPERRVGTLTVQ